MATIRQQVISKMNENKEPDAHVFSWRTIPYSLKLFWIEYFREKKQLKNS